MKPIAHRYLRFSDLLHRFTMALLALAGLQSALQAGTVSDHFETDRWFWDSSTVNVTGTIWDGVLHTGNADDVSNQSGSLVLDMNTNMSQSTAPFHAPTLFRSVTGDFDAVVRIPSFRPDEDFENQGIVAYSDSGNVVEVMNIVSDTNSFAEPRFRSYDSDGGFTQYDDNNVGQKPHLRLRRDGDIFEGFYSDNGASWTRIGTSITRADLPATLSVGLFGAAANTDGDLEAAFDDFSILAESPPSDDFNVIHTYYLTGSGVDVKGTGWDGIMHSAGASWITADKQVAKRLAFEMNASATQSTAPFDAPALYQEVTGDFDVRVQIPTFNGDETYENQGLIAWFNDSNFVELLNIHTGTDAEARFRHYTGGSGPADQLTVSDDRQWLRLVREGDVFEGFYSDDGEAWSSFGQSFTRTDFSPSIRVGLFAATANTKGNFIAQFDNFILIPEPSALMLLAAAAIVLLWRRLRRR